MCNNSLFAKRIERLREESSMSLSSLASSTGVSRTTINNIIKGSDLKATTLIRIAWSLKVTPSDLIQYLEEDMFEEDDI